jgi:predicted lactoylglutathione lyase
MIAYTLYGTNDIEKAKAFYTELLAGLGASLQQDFGRVVLFGKSPAEPSFGICGPQNGQPATAGNGTMTSLLASSREAVDSVYAKALELGATDEGAPGERLPGMYLAYIRDLDGNKLAFFHAG